MTLTRDERARLKVLADEIEPLPRQLQTGGRGPNADTRHLSEAELARMRSAAERLADPKPPEPRPPAPKREPSPTGCIDCGGLIAMDNKSGRCRRCGTIESYRRKRHGDNQT